MHDAAALEELGLPTAVIITTEFEREAAMQRLALGFADLRPVVVEHPISTLSEEALRARAAQAAPQAVSVWLGRT